MSYQYVLIRVEAAGPWVRVHPGPTLIVWRVCRAQTEVLEAGRVGGRLAAASAAGAQPVRLLAPGGHAEGGSGARRPGGRHTAGGQGNRCVVKEIVANQGFKSKKGGR